MDWKTTNKLEKHQLEEAIKGRKKKCARIGCKRKAVAVHHIDHDHSNNTPPNLAPACQFCHDEEHGISAQMTELKLLTREFYNTQKLRIAVSNRIKAYERLGLSLIHAPLALEEIKATEAELGKRIEHLIKQDDFYNIWLKRIKGIGPLLSASLLSEVGNPEQFKTVGQLWARVGLHVIEGKAPRRSKGNKANWNGRLRMTLYKTATSFIKYDCFGRKLYDDYKQYYIQRDGEDPKWQTHNRALRRVMKDFLRCMWRAWLTSKNLPLTEAHKETKIFESDWII